MTDPNRTLIAVLLDRSGSMQSIRSDIAGGFDAFIAAQREESGDATVVLAQFDDEYEHVFSLPIAEVPPLELRPRGSTALLDGVGRLSAEVGDQLAALPEGERPGTVLIVVLTDGHENASREWTYDAVRSVITHQEQVYGWEYIFLGANMDAVSVGRRMGVKPVQAMMYSAGAAEVDSVFRATSDLTSRHRRNPNSAPVEGFSERDRRDAMGADN
ncbi:VWA domain-containing protein [Rhodococcus sp. NPDC060090]|uniref:VWA domain-containing protein n=1 Tax=Rhodococcus sp. NPDC060090 TaxID=3347056 RepID=UPI00365C761D